MTRDELRNLLDSRGADPARWPAARREAAERLLAEDAGARADVEAARRLDAALANSFETASEDERIAANVLSRLNGPLPAQDRPFWHWPAVLLDWQFAPAWPRVAALAGCAVIGFAIGLAGLDRPFDRSGDVMVASRDIGSVVFEPDSLTVRP
jgi:anti-sigma-K factor RskA